MISVIIPTYKEGKTIQSTLDALDVQQQTQAFEIILVDATDDEETKRAAQNFHQVRYVVSDQFGRGNQQNHGASIATGEILLFLHADTMLPDGWQDLIGEYQENLYGAFLKKFDFSEATIGQKILLKCVLAFSNLKVRAGYEFLGDNAIFISKKLFVEVGGFSEGQLMEDVAISRTLRKQKGLERRVIKSPVITSPRRFLQHGVVATAWLMARIRRSYGRGITGDNLRRKYKG